MNLKRLSVLLLILCLFMVPVAQAGGFNPEGLPILTEPETYEVVVAYSAYCLIDWNDKTFYHDRAEETNVNLNFTVLNDWTTQTNLMLASGDLPDLFMGGTIAIDDNLDYFHDLTELIDLYAPSLVEAIDQQPSLVASMKSADGSIRGLSAHFAAKDNYMGTIYWINQDWLDAVDKDIPTTIDELYEVLVAFRDGDPNGNGVQDEIPLAFNEVQWAGKISNMFGLFGVLYNTGNYVAVNDDQQVYFQPSQEAFYDALVWLNRLQSEGLLDGEGFSQTNDQYTAKIAQDILGICARYDPINFLDGFVPIPVITNGDTEILIDGSSEVSGNRNLAITIQCDTPEALVRYYEHVNGDFEKKMDNRFGPRGIYWDYMEDGENFYLHDYDSTPPEGYEFWDQFVYTHGSPGGNGFSFFSKANMDRDLSPKTARVTAIDEYQAYYPEYPYRSAAIDEALTSEMNLLYVEIDAYVQNFVASSILEGIDEARWQAHMDTLNALSVDRYIELRQMAYDAYLSSF